MHLGKINIFSLIIALFIVGCSTNRSLIVLLPEADGSVGSIEIKSKLGSKVINKPFYATRVDNKYFFPTEPEPMEKSEINEVFEDALFAQSEFQNKFVKLTLFFNSGTVKLTEKSRKLLPSILSTVKDFDPIEIFVIGHADRVGTEHYNLNLSSERAKWAKEFLIDSGIESEIMVVSYHGESNPYKVTGDDVAEPLNRRVELIAR